MYKRPHFTVVKKRLEEPRRFLQVITGPRQVGKTTLIQQVLDDTEIPHHFASADETYADDPVWLEQQWEVARLKKQQRESDAFLLVIDEIQKIRNWSHAVKNQWDRDSRSDTNLKVVLLGSSRLLLEEGLTESLAGRFERIFMTHWSFSEMQAAFDITADEYPGVWSEPGLPVPSYKY